MDKKYRNEFYPNNETAEERLFRWGRACTKVPPAKFVVAAVLGFVALFLGIGFIFDGGVFLVVPGGLAYLIGIIGIIVYFCGLKFLERAELLYNTRKASGQKDDIKIEAPKKEKVKEEPALSEIDPELFKVEEILEENVDEEAEEFISEDPEEFVRQIAKASSEDLAIILRDQRDLYSKAELKIIEETLSKREQ